MIKHLFFKNHVISQNLLQFHLSLPLNMISSSGASSHHALQTWYRALTLQNVSNIFRSIVFLCFLLCHLPMLFSLPSLNPLNFFVITIQKISLLIVSVYICYSKARNKSVLGLLQKLPWSTTFEIQSLSLDSTTGAPCSSSTITNCTFSHHFWFKLNNFQSII